MVSTPDFKSQGPWVESHWRQNSSDDCMHRAFRYHPSSQYDLNNVGKDVKHQIILIICSRSAWYFNRMLEVGGHLNFLKILFLYCCCYYYSCLLNSLLCYCMLQGGSSSTLYPLFGIQLSSQRFDLQVTSPMYPRKLIRLVSKIAGAPSSLLHHCHSHTQIKVHLKF